MSFRMTRAQAEEHQRKHGFKNPFLDPNATLEEIDEAMGAYIRPRDPMNKTEREYSLILEAMKGRGELTRWEFEGMRLAWGVDPKTGKPMWYKPDFVVVMPLSAGSVFPIKLIEVKGAHIWDRDIVRFKGARAWWPEFQFEMHQKTKDGWKRLH